MVAVPPRMVLFDLGGVVCRFEPERRLEALARAAGLPPAEVQAGLWGSGFDAECDRGHYDAPAMAGEIAARLEASLAPDALAPLWAHAFVSDAAVLALVHAVRRTVPTALLTDNGPLLEAALPEHLPQVARAFDALLCSWRFGATKRDPALFAAVEAHLGLDGSALALVDDSAAALAGAAAAGWRTVPFTTPAAARDALGMLLGAPLPA